MSIRGCLANTTIRFTVLVLLLQFASSSDPTKPHYHTGKLRPFSGKKIELKLELDEETKLNSEGVVIISSNTCNTQRHDCCVVGDQKDCARRRRARNRHPGHQGIPTGVHEYDQERRQLRGIGPSCVVG